jgi:hypothetical protein
MTENKGFDNYVTGIHSRPPEAGFILQKADIDNDNL